MVTVKELNEALQVLIMLGHGELPMAMTRTRKVDLVGCRLVVDGAGAYVEVGTPPPGAKVIMEP